ncbi:Ig-like domain-containing protein, partial [Kurthia sibirica]
MRKKKLEYTDFSEEKKHYKQYKKKKVWVTALAGSAFLFLGGVADSKLPVFNHFFQVDTVLAAENTSDFLPNTQFNDLSNWDAEYRTAGTLGTFPASPGASGYYPITTKSNLNIGIGALGQGNGVLGIRLTNRVTDGDNFYNGGVRTTTTKELSKYNIYRYSFTSKKESGSNVPFKTRVKDINPDGTLGEEKRLKFDGKYVSTADDWITLNDGVHTVDFEGDDKQLSFGYRFSPNVSGTSIYQLSNISLVNVSPASKVSSTNQIDSGTTTLTGTAIKADDIDNRPTFKDDLVIIYKDGVKLGETKVLEDNTWSFELLTPAQTGENYVYKIQNPNSDLLSEDFNVTVKDAPYDADAHKPTIKEPTAGDNKVDGTGVPGDTIILKDKDGNKIGEGTVDKDGNYTIPTDRP